MFKISFKDNFKKVQTFNQKVTIVTLTGFMDYPAKLWDVVPTEITDWMWHHPTVDVNWAKGGESFRLEFSGKSICSDSDEFNPVLGERIAEARAKIRLYKFLYTFTHKLYLYYTSLAVGLPHRITVVKSVLNQPDSLFKTMTWYEQLYVNEGTHLDRLINEL